MSVTALQSSKAFGKLPSEINQSTNNRTLWQRRMFCQQKYTSVSSVKDHRKRPPNAMKGKLRGAFGAWAFPSIPAKEFVSHGSTRTRVIRSVASLQPGWVGTNAHT